MAVNHIPELNKAISKQKRKEKRRSFGDGLKVQPTSQINLSTYLGYPTSHF